MWMSLGFLCRWFDGIELSTETFHLCYPVYTVSIFGWLFKAVSSRSTNIDNSASGCANIDALHELTL